ncbi:MAG: S1C family serine protease [Mycobacteriales bacterium]
MTDDWHQDPADHEDTRALPSQPGASDDPAPRGKRRPGALPAAVLVGALVLGGAAGVGGAAAFDSLHGDNNTTSSSTPDISANNGTTTSSSNTSSSSDTTIESVAAKVLPSVAQINVRGSSQAGTGSGIVLTKDGTILTNNHVVQVAGENGSIVVNFNDGTSAKATVVGTDPVTDLAVIKAQNVSNLTPADIGKSSDLKVGQGVVAIGSPFGLGATVTSGIVSALDRAVSVSTSEGGGQGNPFGGSQQQAGQSTTYPAIQTDAAINPGNSGGPLVNLDGQVIGINSAIHSDSSSSSSQGGSIGLGFAIPMDEALPIVNQLRKGETPTHARLGITVSDTNTSSSARTGALVKSVQNGAAGDQAGLKAGDVITKLDGEVIEGSDALVATIRGHRPGDTVSLTVLRGGSAQTIKAKLGSDAGSSTS